MMDEFNSLVEGFRIGFLGQVGIVANAAGDSPVVVSEYSPYFDKLMVKIINYPHWIVYDQGWTTVDREILTFDMIRARCHEHRFNTVRIIPASDQIII